MCFVDLSATATRPAMSDEAKGPAKGEAKGLDIGGMSGPTSEKVETERRRKWAEDLVRLQEIKMKQHEEAGPTRLAAQQSRALG